MIWILIVVRLHFAGCTLDLGARQLVRAGREVHLSPKAYALLTVLLEARPRALAKADLLDRVWPAVFVSDASLARVVNEVREAVGDQARDPRILRTVHGFGYAFGADVQSEAVVGATDSTAPCCWLVGRERTISLSAGEHVIGREPGISVCLDSPRVSRRHAMLTVSRSEARIEDLGSKNGTYVAGERLSAPVTLQPGDTIRVGPFTLRFRVGPVATRTMTAVGPRRREGR